MVDLFTPCALGRLHLRNRFVRSATTSAWADERGVVGPEIVARYEELAAGGVGLIIKGHLYVDPRGKAHAGMAGISDNGHVPALADLVGGVHRNGGVIVAQINHAGCEAQAGERMGPSDLETPEWRARAMDDGEIREVIRAFGEAGRRCLDAGFDGVQLHAAHGYLLSQFLSRLANRRTDEWGGSLENRMRLLREVYLELRTRLGDDTVIGAKLNCDDFSESGFTVDESTEVAHELAELGIDFIEVSGGGFGLEAGYQARARAAEDTLAAHPALAEASFAGHCARIREATGPTPLALVDGLRTVACLQAVVDSGLADLVSMCRPFIREPDLVKKLAAGQPAATCTSCDACSSEEVFGVQMMRCTLD
ncbi:MAG: NADH:flavin oxidoreductase [Thermoleophilia bacterium]|nr:NADH:flavin oxidoreductase [Thermoleophilia bacterium]